MRPRGSLLGPHASSYHGGGGTSGCRQTCRCALLTAATLCNLHALCKLPQTRVSAHLLQRDGNLSVAEGQCNAPLCSVPSPLLKGGVLPAIADPRRHRTVQQWTRKHGTVLGYRWLRCMRIISSVVRQHRHLRQVGHSAQVAPPQVRWPSPSSGVLVDMQVSVEPHTGRLRPCDGGASAWPWGLDAAWP